MNRERALLLAALAIGGAIAALSLIDKAHIAKTHRRFHGEEPSEDIVAHRDSVLELEEMV